MVKFIKDISDKNSDLVTDKMKEKWISSLKKLREKTNVENYQINMDQSIENQNK